MRSKFKPLQYIAAIKQEVLDHLRQIRNAPSVQMQEVPEDLLTQDQVSKNEFLHMNFLQVTQPH